MALNKTALRTAIERAFVDEMPDPTPDQEAAYSRVAEKIADAVDAFVKTGTVTVSPGILVTTPDTINGATTGPGTGSIS